MKDASPSRLLPEAFAASLALTAVFVLPRLPPSLDMILPRRAGFWLFSAAMSRKNGLEIGALGLLALSLIAAAVPLWKRRRNLRAAAASKRAGAALLWLVGLVFIGRLCVAAAVDLIQNAWFLPESVDLREPLLTWALCFCALFLFLRAAGSVLAWSLDRDAKARAAAWSAALLALGLSVRALSFNRYDAGKNSLREAAGLSAGSRFTRTFVVLTEKSGAPDYEVHQLEIGVPGQSEFSPESLGAVARYVMTRPSVFRLAGLRYLYGGCTMEMDPAGLRAALAAGHTLGDPAARVLLLENLAFAPPNEAAAHALSLLSREDEYRIGPLAAAQLAVAFEHLGDSEKAAYWRQRSEIPEGLFSKPEPGGPLKPGLIRGQIRGARRSARVGLYAHRNPSAPYALGPGQLVDAMTTDRAGRFEFKGLAAGDYFLALYLDFDRGRVPQKIRLRGHRGDVHLSKAHPRADLPALELSY